MSDEPAQGIGESLEISEMRVEVFHYEKIIHLPINMHESIAKSCHRTERFLQIGRSMRASRRRSTTYSESVESMTSNF